MGEEEEEGKNIYRNKREVVKTKTGEGEMKHV